MARRSTCIRCSSSARSSCGPTPTTFAWPPGAPASEPDNAQLKLMTTLAAEVLPAGSRAHRPRASRSHGAARAHRPRRRHVALPACRVERGHGARRRSTRRRRRRVLSTGGQPLHPGCTRRVCRRRRNPRLRHLAGHGGARLAIPVADLSLMVGLLACAPARRGRVVRPSPGRCPCTPKDARRAVLWRGRPSRRCRAYAATSRGC